MKVFTILTLLLLTGMFNPINSTLYQKVWYRSYSGFSDGVHDYHEIGMSFSLSSGDQAHNGQNSACYALNDSINPNVIGTLVVAVPRTGSESMRYKNYLPLINGASPNGRPYVLFDLVRGPCVIGQQPYFTAKIKYFTCNTKASAFIATLTDNDMLYNDGTNYDFTRTTKKAISLFSSTTEIQNLVQGSDTTICS